MKFQCPSCGLRINGQHFKEAGLLNPKLASICNFCRARGLVAASYANSAVEVAAKGMLYSFDGKSEQSLSLAEKTQPATYLVADKRQRKQLEAFLQDFDTNSLVRQQVAAKDLEQAIISCEDGSLPMPDQGREFSENLTQLGLQVNFQLNEVDYIDRERIRAKYHYRCQYCGRYGRSVDHKDPVSLSHNNKLDNLILACSECNRIKSNMPYDLFVKLNDELKPVNAKLVKYENTLGTLKQEFQTRKRDLAGQVHLKGVVNDPELAAMRKTNKSLQDTIDSLQADYDALRQAREAYFASGWKLHEAGQNPDII
ncbi:HNH endonuclease [Lactobacillus corticis]|uniref:Restriction endonuclease n=1 Tax=Lactobacillus corticis TaxID=2201249 RepID=A0A916QL74_9LACO|nr:HNH endonuclease [Lactobacillus corticis]GFZ27636.1 restriction endonuclease [Lactobacillus corticis]